MKKSDVFRLLKGQIKYNGERDGRKIYKIVCHEERQKEKQDFRVFSIGHSQPANLDTKYMMLLQETGAEKTSFINTLLNYLFGVKFEDSFQLEVEEKIEDGHLETGSRTDIKTVYTVHYQEGMKHRYNFVFIVAPGVADMREQEQQQVIMQHLDTFFTSGFGVENLNCLGIIIKLNINTIIQENLAEEIKSLFQEKYRDITDVSLTQKHDTISLDTEVRDTEISFRIIFKFDNDPLLCPTSNQWRIVTEQYDTFIEAFITLPPSSSGSSTHTHFCNKCNKTCWACNKKSCMPISNFDTALAAENPVLGFPGIAASTTPILAAAGFVGIGLIVRSISYFIGLQGSEGRKCKHSQCNHSISEHIKKQIPKSTKRTRDNEIIDEGMKKKRR